MYNTFLETIITNKHVMIEETKKKTRRCSRNKTADQRVLKTPNH